MATSAGDAQTVVFNVGGTKYEVAKSTIDAYPSTMLARLVSETWTKPEDGNKAIFIDRDGIQFRYVLSYMQDQVVHLPMNVTKASVLQDLAYFGFKDVPDKAFTGSCNYEAALQVFRCKQNHAAAVKKLDEEIQDRHKKKRYHRFGLPMVLSFTILWYQQRKYCSWHGLPSIPHIFP